MAFMCRSKHLMHKLVRRSFGEPLFLGISCELSVSSYENELCGSCSLFVSICCPLRLCQARTFCCNMAMIHGRLGSRTLKAGARSPCMFAQQSLDLRP